VLLILLGTAILLSAFFTAAELAIFFPSESRVRSLSEQNVAGALALAQLRARPERTLVLLRLADTCRDVGAGALVAYIAFPEWQLLGLALATAAAWSFLVLYIGELVPMGIAVNHGQRLALAIAPHAAPPDARAVAAARGLLARLARIRPERRDMVASITETEIRQLTALGHTEGEIEEHERELIERAFRLDETKTWEIMTPRVDIFAWRTPALGDIAPRSCGTVPYSRVPVYGESIDDITGVLYLRDAYQALVSGQRDVRWARWRASRWSCPARCRCRGCCAISRRGASTWPWWWTSTAARTGW
jgi:putative hemolysin